MDGSEDGSGDQFAAALSRSWILTLRPTVWQTAVTVFEDTMDKNINTLSKKALVVASVLCVAGLAPSSAAGKVVYRSLPLLAVIDHEVLKADGGGLPRSQGIGAKVVERPEKAGTEVGKVLCGFGGPAGLQGTQLDWYQQGTLAVGAPDVDKTHPADYSQQRVREGIKYITIAKIASDPKSKAEAHANAVGLFTEAIQVEEGRGVCFAHAYMNRGIAYALQDKPRLGLRDLNKAVECDPESALIRYNLAAVHALGGARDLSLEALDAALQRGFTDCDALSVCPRRC